MVKRKKRGANLLQAGPEGSKRTIKLTQFTQNQRAQEFELLCRQKEWLHRRLLTIEHQISQSNEEGYGPENESQDELLNSNADEDHSYDFEDDEIVSLISRFRNNRMNRLQRESNWSKVRPVFSKTIATGKVSHCTDQACVTFSTRVLLVSFTSAEQTVITTCSCGAKTSALIKRGFFPSAPIKPKLAFSLDVLLLFHNILMNGSLSKYAFAHGLAQTILLNGKVRVPDIKKPWEYAYFNWLECVSHAQKLVEQYLQEQTGHDFNSTSFSNLCPSCFWRKQDGSDGMPSSQEPSCVISIDGNFQHKRFRWVKGAESRVSTTAMFVDPQNSGDMDAVQTGVPGCGHSFAASDSAPKPKTMQNCDETGLMGVNCRHGQPLRYQNMFNGERTGTTANLLQAVTDECPPHTDIYLLYDIACIFSPALQRSRPQLHKRIKRIAIPAFHAFGHKLSCQKSYGPLRTVGIGRSNGEDCERDWSQKAHLVSVGRISSSKHRMMLLENQSIFYAKTQRQRIFSDLERRSTKATFEEVQSRRDLTALAPKILLAGGNIGPSTSSIEELLREQIGFQDNWLHERDEDLAFEVRYPYMKVFAAIKAEQDFANTFMEQDKCSNMSSNTIMLKKYRSFIRSGGTATLEKFQKETDQLLKQYDQQREDWTHDTPLWKMCERMHIWQQLDNIMLRIMKEFATRSLELRAIRSRIRGQKGALPLLRSLRRRMPKLFVLVKRFNEVAKGLPEQGRPQLQTEDFSSEALEKQYNQPLWLIEQARPEAEGKKFLWAEVPDVSHGIDLLHRIDRAAEERSIVQREILRASCWILEYAEALQKCLTDMPEASPIYLGSMCLDCILIMENATKIESSLLKATHLKRMTG